MGSDRPLAPHETVPIRAKTRRAVVGVLVVLALVGVAVWKGHRPRPAVSADGDPRLVFATPFRNVRPEVRYVGDEACASCHPGQAETYREHPMGRSLAPVAHATRVERFDAAAHNPFEHFGLHFDVERRDGGTVHRERSEDFQGRVVAELAAEVQFAVGSGLHGRSYLVNRDGYLYQSPISWFAENGRWDVSPGLTPQAHFDRPVQPLCLFCHSNEALPVEHTTNRYRPPVFHGFAIGCERCHGPGELHVWSRERGEDVAGLDATIVNPRHLEPALREAVCHQCHLAGVQRIDRRGRQSFDYRPGLPLHLFATVFERRAEEAGDARAVGQVEQMVASRCFRESQGRMGCTSCHDPHRLPAAATRVDEYRRRCLGCHRESSCGLPPEARRARSPADDCVACHMPRLATGDIAHTAITDHRILRAPGSGDAERPVSHRLPPGEAPLVPFRGDLLPRGDREVDRDLGIALAELAWKSDPAGRRPLAALAAPLLEQAWRAHADDVPAAEARAGVLQLEGRLSEALAGFEAVLEQAPTRERSLSGAAALAEALKQPEKARELWERAVAVNPWSARPHTQLAKLLGERQEWRKAADECEAVLRVNPLAVPARMFLVQCLLRLGDRERARAEFDRTLALNPPNAEEFRRWFAGQAR